MTFCDERIEYVVKDVETGEYLDIEGRKSVLTDEVMRFVDYLEAADCLDTRADRIIPVRVTTVPGKRGVTQLLRPARRRAMHEGWRCPGCGRCYSPYKMQCGHCPEGRTSSSGDIGRMVVGRCACGCGAPLGHCRWTEVEAQPEANTSLVY